MKEDLVRAANDLKAAAEALLEIATRPVLDLAALGDEQKEALRSLVNPWLEEEYKKQLASLPTPDVIHDIIGERVECLATEDYVDEAIDNAKGELGHEWNEIDPDELAQVMRAVGNVDLEEMNDACQRIDDIDPEDVERAAELAGKIDDIENQLDELEKNLKPVLDFLDAVKKAKAPAPAVTAA